MLRKFLVHEQLDWTLAEESPALQLGFRPIDLSDVGPRPLRNAASKRNSGIL